MPIPIPISGISEPKYCYRYLLIISLALLSASRKCAFFLDPDFDYFDYFREVQCELERKTHFEITISLYYCPIMWYYVYCQVIDQQPTHPESAQTASKHSILLFCHIFRKYWPSNLTGNLICPNLEDDNNFVGKLKTT